MRIVITTELPVAVSDSNCCWCTSAAVRIDDVDNGCLSILFMKFLSTVGFAETTQSLRTLLLVVRTPNDDGEACALVAGADVDACGCCFLCCFGAASFLRLCCFTLDADDSAVGAAVVFSMRSISAAAAAAVNVWTDVVVIAAGVRSWYLLIRWPMSNCIYILCQFIYLTQRFFFSRSHSHSRTHFSLEFSPSLISGRCFDICLCFLWMVFVISIIVDNRIEIAWTIPQWITHCFERMECVVCTCKFVEKERKRNKLVSFNFSPKIPKDQYIQFSNEKKCI